jgi:hypothetical protein
MAATTPTGTTSGNGGGVPDNMILSVFSQWHELNARLVQTSGIFDDIASILLAAYILTVCFRDCTFCPHYPHLLQLWLRDVCVRMSRDVFSVTAGFTEYSLPRLNEAIIGVCKRVREELTLSSSAAAKATDSERLQFTIGVLQQSANSNDVHSVEYLALQECLHTMAITRVRDDSDREFGKPLIKEQDVLAQAAGMVIMILSKEPPHAPYKFVHDELSVGGCMYPNLAAFVSEFEGFFIRRGDAYFFAADEQEMLFLKFNAELMFLAKKFIPVDRAKGRYMQIASAIIENRQYTTGGGNFKGSQRREKMFEVISGTRQFMLYFFCVS